MIARENIRNVAIVAHVDHGKTTLVDFMLRQAGVFRSNEAVADRVMDSNDLEREKGITILAKNTTVNYGGYRINIIDTPGHADFGGEVERGLRLVDGVLLLVDAAEGPLPGTRYVLRKALAMGLKTVLVINKIDRSDARAKEVLDMVYGLYIDLGADEEHLEFPVIYAVARQGQASLDLDTRGTSLEPLFKAIIDVIPPPPAPTVDVPQMLVANLDYDDFVGRLAIGRISAGTLKPNMNVALVREGDKLQPGKIVKLYGYQGLKKVEVPDAGPGEIVAIAGIEDISIGDTLTDAEKPAPLPRITVDEPTMQMIFRVNDGPLAGKEGKYVTSRNLRERLYREAYRNVSLRVEDTATPDAFKVVGRGELALAVLIETMRREGYELTASNPEPVTHNVNGEIHEPMEIIEFDVPDTGVGATTERLGPRKGRMTDMTPSGTNRTKITFRIPARGLVGFRNEFLTVTRGEGVILGSTFDGYEPWAGPIFKRQNGAMVSDRQGDTVPYALFSIQERGALFVTAGVQVYEGMIIGEHAHPSDLNVNCCREKKLTNIRAAGRDENVILTPPREMGLEKALEWITNDELVEVTPKSVRMRKRYLAQGDRYRADRDRKREALADEAGEALPANPRR